MNVLEYFSLILDKQYRRHSAALRQVEKVSPQSALLRYRQLLKATYLEKKRLRTRAEKMKAANDRLKTAVGRQKAALEKHKIAKTKILAQQDKLRAQTNLYKQNAPVNRYLRFAQLCYDSADQLTASVCIAHGVQALPAAVAITGRAGGDMRCDVIEIPSFRKRAIRSNWHPTNLDMLDGAFNDFIRSCAGVTTVGHELAKDLELYNVPISVIPNYRRYNKPVGSAKLRKDCGVGEDDTLILAMSTITIGLEEVIKAVTMLPPNSHLAVVGRFSPADYQARVQQLISECGLEARVHILDPVPYEELVPYASSADAGLVVLDPAIPNHSVAFPNRLFDYIASSLPVVSPDIPDIRNCLERYGIGTTIDSLDSESWATGIRAVLDRKEAMASGMERANKELCWENLEQQLYASLGKPDSVLFVGFNDLTKNNRTMRMASSLKKLGASVRVCCPKNANMPQKLPRGVAGFFTDPC